MLFFWSVFFSLGFTSSCVPIFGQGFTHTATGELCDGQAILQGKPKRPDVNQPGEWEVEISDDSLFQQVLGVWKGTWDPSSGLIKVKVRLTDSIPLVYYRWKPVHPKLMQGPQGRFFIGSGASYRQVSLVVSSCMHYDKWMFGPKLKGDGAKGTSGEVMGFPALKAIAESNPDFWILNGDNVYYDHNFPPDTAWENRAKTPVEMRRKWELLFQMPSLAALLQKTSTFWLKDDHDFRYDDADRTDTNRYLGQKIGKFMPFPTVKDGIRIFREQTPTTFPIEEGQTFRTHRLNRDVQVWFLEGRDFRDPKFQSPGPEKSIWGIDQRNWLLQTLKNSKAPYKIVISPTPLIGPDEARKTDSHANPMGYAAEADTFFQFLLDNHFSPDSLFIVCGDRHWAYHSQHRTGFHEFCSGALNRENSRAGIKPGTPNSSDPDGKIKSWFVQTKPLGSFLQLKQQGKVLQMIWKSETGEVLHRFPGDKD